MERANQVSTNGAAMGPTAPPRDPSFRRHDDVREGQHARQPVQKARWCLVVLALYLQELNGQAIPLGGSEHEPQT
jgi:hypothetical protein